jgi:hypothetical protein
MSRYFKLNTKYCIIWGWLREQLPLVFGKASKLYFKAKEIQAFLL